MPVRAIAKGVSMSPRKVSIVAGLVRGRTVDDALTILEHTPRRAALPVKKAILSARANADYNHGFKKDTLTITHISVMAGPRQQRYRAAARGSARPFQKKSSNIYVTVDGEKRAIKKPIVKTVDKEKKQ